MHKNYIIKKTIREEIQKLFLESSPNQKFYRAMKEFVGDETTFVPKGFYEGIDDNDEPIMQNDSFWISDTPELSASKYIGGAVMGSFSTKNLGSKPTNIFFIYEINEKPDKDISHWSIGDFAFLEEVRYRRNVSGKFIGKVIINENIQNLIDCWYEFYNSDPWDEEESENCQKFKNIEDFNDFLYKQLKKIKVNNSLEESNTKRIIESFSKDMKKIKFSEKYWKMFMNYNKENIETITEELFNTAYYNFKIGKLHVELTLEKLSNEIGDTALGQYDDFKSKLLISLYPIFEQFLKKVDENPYEDLENYEIELVKNGIKKVLTTEDEWNRKIKDVFEHEIIHHFDASKYGSGYKDNAEYLEKIKEKINSYEERTNYYANMPHEIDAFFMSALKKLLDNHGNKKKNYQDFQMFFDMFLNYFFPYHKLSKENKNKIIKRLYLFFNNFK